MKALAQCRAFLLYLLNLVTLSPWSDTTNSQKPLGDVADHGKYHDGPIFSPPSAPDDFKCDYSRMGSSWTYCSTPEDRGCWLTNGTFEYNIYTDYEKLAPNGTLRKYTLDVTKMALQPDGYNFTEGKVFNMSYPGPWLQACWGDDIEVTVTNYLEFNGTTIHWHGIRQLGTTEMDGVNGVSQCPIAGAPKNDHFTYKFKALQYGTTWYHSHYSLQYADGLLGPLTLHGPSSSNYDDHIKPILMTDWNHQSAFQLFYQEITPGKGPPKMLNSLVNGIGQYKCTQNETKAGICVDGTSRYNTTVQYGKKYLLRLINTSVDTTFIFSIDDHELTVMSSDFVPIHPYTTNSVLVGIGQRYHVVLETKPNILAPKSYWIRTVPAENCNTFPTPPDNRTGILFYGDDTKKYLPNTTMNTFPIDCSDEPYEFLKPIVPWTVAGPSNDQQGSSFAVGIANEAPPPSLPPGGLNFSRWELSKQSLWLNFSNPTYLHVDKNVRAWAQQLVVVPENNPPDSWVYLLVSTQGFPFGNLNRNFIPASHPIHLHGHDFAILQQSRDSYWDGVGFNMKLDNPPRRDVALLPGGGFLLLAFKSDNPGAWLVHCHIAWHASGGLALQILERDGVIPQSTASLEEAERICDNWNAWYGDKRNWYNASADFQDDSGI